MRSKLLAVLAGAVAGLLLLEAGLRILGAVAYLRAHRDRATFTPGVYRVLCIGDSFTVGMGAPKESSYPRQLERLLNAGGGRRFEVINRGVMAQNTSMLLETLPGLLSSQKPDLVVLLTGGYNTSNYYGYGRYRSDQGPVAALGEALYHVKTYKLLRQLTADIGKKDLPRTPAAESGPRGTNRCMRRPSCRAILDEGFRYRQERRAAEAIRMFEKALEKHPACNEAYRELGTTYKDRGDIERAERYLQKAVDLLPGDGESWARLGWINLTCGKYEKAFSLFSQGVRADPWIAENYDGLTALRNTLSGPQYADRIRDLLSETAKRNPGVRVPALDRALAAMSLGSFDLGGWIVSDIEDIVSRCRERGVPVIVQNYPWRFSLDGNRLIAAASSRADALFVDNEAVFSALPAGDGENGYMSYDRCHCNARGYGVMAENVYRVIVENRERLGVE